MRLPGIVETLVMLKKIHFAIAASQHKDSIVAIACQCQSTFIDTNSLGNEWNVVNLDQWPKYCFENDGYFLGETREKKNIAGESNTQTFHR